MDWDRLKTFYHVATAGSISRAMDTIHLSQSAITRQIQSLEHSLKTKLFKCNATSKSLTTKINKLKSHSKILLNSYILIEKKLLKIFL